MIGINPSYRTQRFAKKTKEGILPFNADGKEDWFCECGGNLCHFGNRIECNKCNNRIPRMDNGRIEE